jgi:hypothetical protein
MDTQTRRRTKSSTRRALESTVTEFDELLATPELKDAKRGDILIAKANALKELLALEAADRDTETQDTISLLEDQHASDTQRISALEFENSTLRAKSDVIREVPDPEHAKVRQQNFELTEALSFIVRGIREDDKAACAIRAVQTLSRDAFRRLCDAMEVDWKMYLLMLNRPDSELRDQVEKAQVRGPACIAAEAILAARGVKVPMQDDWL